MSWSHKPGWNQEDSRHLVLIHSRLKAKFFSRFTWSSSRSSDSQELWCQSVLSFWLKEFQKLCNQRTALASGWAPKSQHHSQSLGCGLGKTFCTMEHNPPLRWGHNCGSWNKFCFYLFWDSDSVSRLWGSGVIPSTKSWLCPAPAPSWKHKPGSIYLPKTPQNLILTTLTVHSVQICRCFSMTDSENQLFIAPRAPPTIPCPGIAVPACTWHQFLGSGLIGVWIQSC